MIRAATLAALLALAPLPAGAATMGAVAVDPTAGVGGSFDARGTQTWTLSLAKGRTYAVYGTSDPTLSVLVREAGGGVLGRFVTFDSTGDAEGVSLKAPYTGRYAVEVTCGADCTPPSRYYLSAAGDCPGGTSSPCAIRAGQTLRGLGLSFVGTLGPSDEDWFRADLVAGGRYVASLPRMTAHAGCVYLGFRDAAGRVLGRDQEECADPSGAGTPPVAFRPTRAGRYFVVVRPGDETTPSTYDLSLIR